MSKYIAAIDQGTTSTRCFLFNHSGNIVSSDQKEHKQIYPKPGWVEHDALEIWENSQVVVRGALKNAKATSADVAAIGITNQRETTLVWEKETGKPVWFFLHIPSKRLNPEQGCRVAVKARSCCTKYLKESQEIERSSLGLTTTLCALVKPTPYSVIRICCSRVCLSKR